ncbi:MAG: DUF1330 domain-containing protein [Pseudomonadota bacterium]
MAKGYWIARLDVSNQDRYHEYVEAATPAYKEHGAKFLIRGGAIVAEEGTSRSRNVVIEFDSVETALACYNSETYAKARKIRQELSVGELIVVEGA